MYKVNLKNTRIYENPESKDYLKLRIPKCMNTRNIKKQEIKICLWFKI